MSRITVSTRTVKIYLKDALFKEHLKELKIILLKGINVVLVSPHKIFLCVLKT